MLGRFFGRDREAKNMSNLDYWIASSEPASVNIERESSTKEPIGLSNESLFHLPLLACVVLTLSRQRRPLRTHEVGQFVGECLEKTFIAFKGSAQYLGWSANLRIRTVSALGFLEAANLVVVNNKGHVSATDHGRKIIDKAIDAQDDLAMTIIAVQRVYRDVISERGSQMELS
jgi:hypothetical protein